MELAVFGLLLTRPEVLDENRLFPGGSSRRNPGVGFGSPMCHTLRVTLKITLRPGQSIFDQVVFAAKKAFVSGELQPGDDFPSVRALAADLKIHPNTAHKVIQHLIQERLLEVRPGIGTVVAEAPPARPGDKRRLMQNEIEQLVVEAKRVGATLDEVIEALQSQWGDLDRPRAVRRA